MTTIHQECIIYPGTVRNGALLLAHDHKCWWLDMTHDSQKYNSRRRRGIIPSLATAFFASIQDLKGSLGNRESVYNISLPNCNC